MCHSMTLYYTPVLEQTMITESIWGCSIRAILALIDSAGMLRTIPSPLLSAGSRETPEVSRAVGFNCQFSLIFAVFWPYLCVNRTEKSYRKSFIINLREKYANLKKQQHLPQIAGVRVVPLRFGAEWMGQRCLARGAQVEETGYFSQ